MNHTTTEVQPLDEFYKAFLIGGFICLIAAGLVEIIRTLPLQTTGDGSGLALLLLLSTGGILVSRGLTARTRLRYNVSA